MPSNFTENYNLSQWERTDKVQMEDFNADNAKLDAALKAGADARAALQSALAKKGNCSIGLSTYTGTGTYGSNNPTRITFPKMPVMYIILGGDLMIGGAAGAVHTYPISGGCVACAIQTTWSGNTVSFYGGRANEQMNSNTVVYQVIAFYAE